MVTYPSAQIGTEFRRKKKKMRIIRLKEFVPNKEGTLFVKEEVSCCRFWLTRSEAREMPASHEYAAQHRKGTGIALDTIRGHKAELAY